MMWRVFINPPDRLIVLLKEGVLHTLANLGCSGIRLQIHESWISQLAPTGLCRSEFLWSFSLLSCRRLFQCYTLSQWASQMIRGQHGSVLSSIVSKDEIWANIVDEETWTWLLGFFWRFCLWDQPYEAITRSNLTAVYLQQVMFGWEENGGAAFMTSLMDSWSVEFPHIGHKRGAKNTPTPQPTNSCICFHPRNSWKKHYRVATSLTW